jgi:hypothetical protein
VRDNVTIAYRGASYEIGRGPTFYAIWATSSPQEQALEWWPDTPEGWYAAWARFIAIEALHTIVPVEQPSAPSAPASQLVQANTPETAPTTHIGEPARPETQAALQFAQATAPEVQPPVQVAPSGAPTEQPTTTFASPTSAPPAWPAATVRPAAVQPAAVLAGREVDMLGSNALAPDDESAGAALGSSSLRPAVRAVAVGLIVTGVICGISGLFPDYLDGASLAQQPPQLVPHVIYFAVWTLSAVLILLGGNRLRAGALLGLGTSLVTFGFYFADAGTAVAAGAHVMGAGLVLGLVGWLACFAGSAAALAAGRKGDTFARPRGPELVPFLALSLAAIGAAAAFAPSWDSYVLQNTAGTTDSFTQGNIFSNPAPVIAGNVAVMVALVAVVMAAGLWRPVLRGGVLLAGAIIPLVAQAVSAIIQLSEGATPAMFGISSASAQRAGLTITTGLTVVFWIYCIFVVALIVMGASSLIAPPNAATTSGSAAPYLPASGVYSQHPGPSTPTGAGPFGPVTPGEG